MEELVKKVKGVLEKYSKKYTTDGVTANLSVWNENKQSLINLLRNHPDWNEEALAVIIDVVETREIDELETLDSLSQLEFLHPVFSNKQPPTIYQMNNYAMYCNALYEAVTPFQKMIGEETAEAVKQYTDIGCASGEKCSKVINKVCESFGIHEHSEYNKLFAKLSDKVNPHAIKRKVILSVHPGDYLEMSNKDNSWSSCHGLYGGGYQAGTLSYMNDGVSMILYSISNTNATGDFYKLPKVSREVFCYKDGVLLQSRLYPDNSNNEIKREFGEIAKGIFAACYSQTAYEWTNGQSVETYCVTHEDSLHYRDYEYSKYDANIFLLNGLDFLFTEAMTIGEQAYCMYCGEPVNEHGNITCDECIDKPMYYCSVCGEDITEFDLIRDENGEVFCGDCYERRNAVQAA